MGLGRILLTGANGFVGRQVGRCLPVDTELHCTSRSGGAGDKAAIWHQIDLRDPAACQALIRKVRPDTLIHCAWNTAHGQFWEAQDNGDWLDAGKALFTAFADLGGQRIVSCGTCAEYSRDKAHPHGEDEAIDPTTPAFFYGRAKLALFRHLERLDISHAWVRIFLTYGEGEDSRRLIPSILRALLSGEPARCSSGTQLRDFIDIRDVGEAIAMLASSEVQGALNIGSGVPTRIGDVAQILGEITGRPDLVRLGTLPDRPGEAPVLIPDIRRQVEELGFVPRIGLKQGLLDAAKAWSTGN